MRALRLIVFVIKALRDWLAFGGGLLVDIVRDRMQEKRGSP